VLRNYSSLLNGVELNITAEQAAEIASLPFVAGVGLTLAIMYRWYNGIGPNQWGLIPAIWMLFYGIALWQLGEFSPREVRFLGAAFILIGCGVVFACFRSVPWRWVSLGAGVLALGAQGWSCLLFMWMATMHV